MEPSNLLELAKSQGPVFWVAAVAIALGATLLVVALGQFLRHRFEAGLLGRSAVKVITPPTTPAETYEPTQPPVPPAMMSNDPLAEAAPTRSAAAPTPAPTPRPRFEPEFEPRDSVGGDYSLALLLRRLQTAGDRLEEMAGDLRSVESGPEESALKDDLRDVEYVFRASGP